MAVQLEIKSAYPRSNCSGNVVNLSIGYYTCSALRLLYIVQVYAYRTYQVYHSPSRQLHNIGAQPGRIASIVRSVAQCTMPAYTRAANRGSSLKEDSWPMVPLVGRVLLYSTLLYTYLFHCVGV
jgi:hypothetical protein